MDDAVNSDDVAYGVVYVEPELAAEAARSAAES